MAARKKGNPPMASWRMAVRRDEFEAALATYRDAYTEEECALLVWFWGFCFSEDMKGNMTRVAQEIQYDAGNIGRILRGTYNASLANFLEAVRFLQQERLRTQGRFAETPVTRAIGERLRLAYDRRWLGMVFGPTGRSKSLTFERHTTRHNHGITTYVRCRSACTRSKLVRLVTHATGQFRTTHMSVAAMEDSVFDWFTGKQRKLLIIDEANHLMNHSRARSVAMAFEFIRDLYDVCNVGIVLGITGYDAAFFRRGSLGDFFEQFRGRTVNNLEIPRTVFKDEVKAILSLFTDNPSPGLFAEAYDIANSQEGALRTLVHHLDDAAELIADDPDLDLDADVLRAVRTRHKTGAANWPDK